MKTFRLQYKDMYTLDWKVANDDQGMPLEFIFENQAKFVAKLMSNLSDYPNYRKGNWKTVDSTGQHELIG